MRGDHNSSIHFLAVVNTPTDHTVEITPISQELHAMTVELADNVLVHRDLKKLLDKAGITPPPFGMALTAKSVQESISAAKLTTNESIAIKQGLVNLRMLHEGPAFNIFKPS